MANLNIRLTPRMEENLTELESITGLSKTEIIKELLFIGVSLDAWEKKFTLEAENESDRYGKALYKGIATTYTSLKKILMFKEI